MAKKKTTKPKMPDMKVWHKEWVYHQYYSGLSFGVLLFIVGAIWLSSELGWIPEIPFWPTLLLVVGIWIIVKAMIKRKHCH